MGSQQQQRSRHLAPFGNMGLSNADPGDKPWNSLRMLRGQDVRPQVWYQPRSIVPRPWTQPELRAFASDENRGYLKREVLRRFHGGISDMNLLSVMDENAAFWRDKYIDATYGGVTIEQLMHAVRMMNERTLRRIGQLYASQRAVSQQWLQMMHQPEHMNSAMPQDDGQWRLDGYDMELTL